MYVRSNVAEKQKKKFLIKFQATERKKSKGKAQGERDKVKSENNSFW